MHTGVFKMGPKPSGRLSYVAEHSKIRQTDSVHRLMDVFKEGVVKATVKFNITYVHDGSAYMESFSAGVQGLSAPQANQQDQRRAGLYGL